MKKSEDGTPGQPKIWTKPTFDSWINLRTKFYTPEKAVFGQAISTYWVNVVIIWIMTIGLMIALYYDWLRKIVDIVGEFREHRMRKKELKVE